MVGRLRAMQELDALILADSPHARTKLLGLTLVERGRRVALRAGARDVFVLDSASGVDALRAWAAGRRAGALLGIRADDQVVHKPLVEPLLRGRADRRRAAGRHGARAGAPWVGRERARGESAAAAPRPGAADRVRATRWQDAEPIAHRDIARHAAPTAHVRAGARAMLLRLN